MPQVRISVANLATSFQGEDSDGNLGSRYYFGIPNPAKLKKDGTRELQALGGAAQLTKAGVDYLVKKFGASDFEIDKGIADARFLVGDSRLDEVFDFFTEIARKPNEYELDPTADIMEELTGGEFGDAGPILRQLDPGTISVEYVETVRQKVAEDGTGTSERSQAAAVPTRRLFRRYNLLLGSVGPEEMHLVRVLTEEDLATTNGGATKGHTSDGLVMRDNLFL